MREPYLLKVTSLGGSPLKKPIVAEYLLRGTKKLALGQEYRFWAYEDVYTSDCSFDETANLRPATHNIRNRLVVRNSASRADGRS